MMSAGVPRLRPAPETREQAARVVGLEPADLDPELPLAVEDAGARLVVPVRSLERLLALQPALAEMVAYGAASGYRRYTLVCRQTLDPHAAVHLRHFAPANGIPEDPVTGTAHAVIAAYLDQQGLLPQGELVRLQGEQGHAVNRPGTVAIELHRAGSTVVDVRVGGSGFIVSQGIIADP
jgi:PhzF family phenazine biosynthesis protein